MNVPACQVQRININKARKVSKNRNERGESIDGVSDNKCKRF